MNEPTTKDATSFDDPLSLSLAALSEPRSEPATLWRTAMATTHPASTRPAGRVRGKRFFLSNMGMLVVAVMSVFLISVFLLPTAVRSRSYAPRSGVAMQLATPDVKSSMNAGEPREHAGENALRPAWEPGERDRFERKLTDETAKANPAVHSQAVPATPGGASRHVILKATIELATKDVPATFAKANLVINESLGEFIERSVLRRDTGANSSEIVLRVSASRLGAVLTQLRQFGTVTSESAGGDDVTDRVVDLEARLRNERRIESELLKLLDSRAGSSLEDVLKLRTELSGVRLSIERLDGQMLQLGRSVSLATVLVLIRPDGALAQPMSLTTGLGEYFTKTMSKAWTSGMKGLADSVSLFVENLLAGLVWWIVLLIFGVLGFALLKRAYRAAANEPAPRL
ncbi:MAG: DUF4349 domain-containing protein [Pyrinomonadaceae bacterium]|nr:DUF4349 domain-containing protein [Phycisphaerales bacterium]